MKPMEGASVQLSIPTFVPGDWATNSEADATISANAKDAQRRRTRNNPLRQLQISMRNNGGFELTSRPLRHVIRWCFFAYAIPAMLQKTLAFTSRFDRDASGHILPLRPIKCSAPKQRQPS